MTGKEAEKARRQIEKIRQRGNRQKGNRKGEENLHSLPPCLLPFCLKTTLPN